MLIMQAIAVVQDLPGPHSRSFTLVCASLLQGNTISGTSSPLSAEAFSSKILTPPLPQPHSLQYNLIDIAKQWSG